MIAIHWRFIMSSNKLVFLWWPTTVVTAKPKTSRQNQKPHGKNKIPHSKNKDLTEKTRYLTAKLKTSWQNQILHSKNKIALVLTWVFAFAVRYLVLQWGFCRFCLEGLGTFCREVFCSCREVFGFVVSYFVFAVRFLVLPWQLWATVFFCFKRILKLKPSIDVFYSLCQALLGKIKTKKWKYANIKN